MIEQISIGNIKYWGKALGKGYNLDISNYWGELFHLNVYGSYSPVACVISAIHMNKLLPSKPEYVLSDDDIGKKKKKIANVIKKFRGMITQNFGEILQSTKKCKHRNQLCITCDWAFQWCFFCISFIYLTPHKSGSFQHVVFVYKEPGQGTRFSCRLNSFPLTCTCWPAFISDRTRTLIC